MLIENTLLGEVNRVETAIERYKQFYPADRIPIIAFSGGKDSAIIYAIAEMAGLPFRSVYSPPSVDPPELIYHIRKYYPKVEILPYNKDKNGQTITMWTLIPRKLMPPTSMVRYCCDELKERAGEIGDTVYTGIRWAESKSRSQQSMVNFWKGKIMIRPIVDWSDEDVWEFIKLYKIPYCKLYDEGWNRLGCVGCPKAPGNMEKELNAYPKIKANYIRAFEKMIAERIRRGKPTQWKTGEEVMDWWVRKNKSQAKQSEDQCSMF